MRRWMKAQNDVHLHIFSEVNYNDGKTFLPSQCCILIAHYHH